VPRLLDGLRWMSVCWGPRNKRMISWAHEKAPVARTTEARVRFASATLVGNHGCSTDLSSIGAYMRRSILRSPVFRVQSFCALVPAGKSAVECLSKQADRRERKRGPPLEKPVPVFFWRLGIGLQPTRAFGSNKDHREAVP